MYLIHQEEKYVVAERFIITLLTKIYKYMTSISKHVYIDKLQKINQEEFRIEKVTKRKCDKLYVIKMCQYFPKPYEPFCGNINVKVDLPIYVAKADIKKFSQIDTSSCALKSNLARLKIVQWPYKIILTLITYGFLFHFMLVGVT